MHAGEWIINSYRIGVVMPRRPVPGKDEKSIHEGRKETRSEQNLLGSS